MTSKGACAGSEINEFRTERKLEKKSKPELHGVAGPGAI